jgi:DNA modification methylase
MSAVTVHHGDSREVLKTLADCSIDSVVCDPPYALVSVVQRFGNSPRSETTENTENPYGRTGRGFMGQKWDTGETAFSVEFWAEVLRVLKPGGHVVAFSGTRTYHRLACAIEDAGFEIRDQLAWAYGSGFPKSHNVSKGIDKAAGAERPVISKGRAVKRMIPGADQANDGWAKTSGREYVPTVSSAASAASAAWEGWGTALKPAWEPIVLARKPLDGTVAANVQAHGVGALNIDGCRVDGAKTPAPVGQFRGSDVGATGLRGERDGSSDHLGRWPANIIHDGSEEVTAGFPDTSSGGYPPAGGMRSKVSTYGEPNERGEQRFTSSEGSASRFFYSAKADAEDRLGSKHPTVKPVDLMQWLCRLVTPPGGVVLDPFAGSGSTGIACLAEGFDTILIEREADYVADINRRMAWARGEGRLTALELARDIKPAEAAGADLPLFSGDAA